ncbi:MAG: A24 family peptidase [Persicimonas sp.]
MKTFVEFEWWIQLLFFGPLVAYLLTAAIWDGVTAFKSEDNVGRIPNKLSYSSVLVGLVCHTAVAGLDGLLAGLLAVAVIFGVGIFMAAFNLLGGGDVKLLMGVGAWLGLGATGELLFYAVLAGSAIGLVLALFSGYLKDMLVRMFRFMRGLFRMVLYKTDMVRENLETDARSHMPFAVPILAGAILAYTEAVYGWPGLLAWFLEPFVAG